MLKGGKRKGAGRKKGGHNRTTIIEAQARQILIDKILTRWYPIINTLLDVGLGKTKLIRHNKKGVEMAYYKAPDARVLQELLAYAVGRPRQEFGADINLPQLAELTGSVRQILEKRDKTK